MHKYMKVRVTLAQSTDLSALSWKCPGCGSCRPPSLPGQAAQLRPSQERPPRTQAPCGRSQPKISASCSLQVPEATWLRSVAQLTGRGRVVFQCGEYFSSLSAGNSVCKATRLQLPSADRGGCFSGDHSRETLSPTQCSHTGEFSHLAQGGPVEPHPLYQRCV